ncbi:MAG: exonuclease domain-containing protein [Oscillospiraceae bacterium]|jgi:DNA polymerase III epsilon subunit-like protein|nr:exonuclease domain-containing protein [Oscillospiraceae bacterium]MCI1991410.1 exonuclease domain-containing protein [Oscillospiraceae bacterium]MCI2036327.1 exonuclease domain-containing protein [Oscillospiraceae bacterium]
MDFVILDLEWNGAYSKKLKGFLNEIIEFGAVRVDGQLNIVDTFEALIHPQVGKKISGKIRTLTSITNEDLDGGLRFMQAVSRFCKWAKGAVVMTWGTSDILALIENCRYFCGNGRIPFLERYVDLQAYCEHLLQNESGQQMGLGTAAGLLGIDADGFDHHRALGDSLLTLRCFQKLYDPEKLKPFCADASRSEFYKKMEFKTVAICDLHHPLIQPRDLAFCCDLCGKRARRVGEWQLRSKSFRAEFFCRHCGHKFYGRVQFKLKYEGLIVKKAILPVKEPEKKPDAKEEPDRESG